MDYKKAYRDALKRAEAMIQIAANKDEAIDFKNTIFPELKESEDERIRKEIIDFLQETIDNVGESPNKWTMYNAKKWIAWLEKQGEQKPADKIEPKFKIGDWIVEPRDNERDHFWHINKIDDENYWDGICGVRIKYADEKYHLWTIQDAKDGDVLLFEGNYNSIVLFQGIGINGKGRINYHCKCDLGNYSFGIQGDVACLGTVEEDAEHYHPATEEQRDLLFQKMHEAGYEWDANKKELKKIEKIDEKHKVGEYFTGLIPCWINAPSTQQPAHNYHGKNIIAIHLKDGEYRCCCIDDEKPVTFTLPENTPLVEGWKRKSAEWSEEDEKIIETMCKEGDLRPSQRIWLKSLKNRVQPQPKQEWSEEDADAIGMAVTALEDLCDVDYPADSFIGHNLSFYEAVERLKVLKPQPHWKPTEEQMSMLLAVLNDSNNIAAESVHIALKSLYNDLKKL